MDGQERLFCKKNDKKCIGMRFMGVLLGKCCGKCRKNKRGRGMKSKV